MWRTLMRAGPRPASAINGNGSHHHGSEEDLLEAVVDVHAFTPADLGQARTPRRLRSRCA